MSSANVTLILCSMFFFPVLSFFCSFLFFIRNTRDRHDRATFLHLATQISELSQKYDCPLIIVPALIRFFKNKISMHRMGNHFKYTISDSAK